MYMQDHTGRDIATKINNLSVDTTGLVKDTTVQTTNSKLDDIKTAINNISFPSAANISYDNTASGLSANNVQSAIDKLNSEKQDNTMGGPLTAPDFNNLVENKYYSINTAGSLNAPVNVGYGFLEVIVISPTIRMQRFTRFVASGSEMCRTYVRQYINSQWYAWVQIY